MSEATALERSPDSHLHSSLASIQSQCSHSRDRFPAHESFYFRWPRNFVERRRHGAFCRRGIEAGRPGGGRIYSSFFIASDTGGRQNLQSFRLSLRGGVHRAKRQMWINCACTDHLLNRAELRSREWSKPGCALDRRYACRARMVCRSARKRRRASSLSGVASTISSFAWKTWRPSFSVSTPMASPMRQPGVPSICIPPTEGTSNGNAVVAHHADALGKPVEGLEFKSGKIDTLKLFGGIRHEESF